MVSADLEEHSREHCGSSEAKDISLVGRGEDLLMGLGKTLKKVVFDMKGILHAELDMRGT